MATDFIINSSFGSYEVDFIPSTTGYNFQRLDSRSDYVIVADLAVWEMHSANYPFWKDFPLFLVEANEFSKTLDKVSELARWLVENNATKTTTILAFGGGVIQDLVTFTSRIFHRGCRWEYHPTTLLSQADSCIGAKCGINVMPHKNQLGAVYAPKRVVINQELLKTLPENEIFSGFGEIFKLSITGPNHFYESLKVLISKSHPLLPEGAELEFLIKNSLNAKKAIIEEDEHENGWRRILNYGHTFGHALETLSGNTISHGSAVVFGMDLINFLGLNWGITFHDFYSDFKNSLKQLYGNVKMPPNITPKNLVEQIKTDKKMEFGKLHFAVPRKVGEIEIVARDLDKSLLDLVSKYLNEENVFITA